ncbi:MAG TPA: S1 RNA-binding domain-containing protein [Oscillospiraceae bacterium]|nr:S1 RNA-binding domain-containing protein [Oscillospiraceae bacterium]HPK35575.1 S1 RNA-binding domain-containing protein [Oscillospiraceae bacterium]HPR75888.1 S1 RNA-binding domain-containing protein [Oscillospiraceae bacterium]
MELEVGAIYTGKVTGITKFGAFIELQPGTVGMVHISEIANSYVEKVSDFLTLGQEVKVKLISIGDGNKLGLSIKKVDPPAPPPSRPQTVRPQARPQEKKADLDPFEEMMAKFKQSSEEKISDLRKSTESRRGSGGYAPRKR